MLKFQRISAEFILSTFKMNLEVLALLVLSRTLYAIQPLVTVMGTSC